MRRTHAEKIQNGYLDFSWTDEEMAPLLQVNIAYKAEETSTGILLGQNTMESLKRLSCVIPITKLHENFHTAKIKACSQRIVLLQKSKE